MSKVQGENYAGRANESCLIDTEYVECNFAMPEGVDLLHTGCVFRGCNLSNCNVREGNVLIDCFSGGGGVNTEIEIARARKIKEVEQRTDDLLDMGFSWNGNVFSMETQAQSDWVGLMLLLDTIVYPFRGPAKNIEGRAISYNSKEELLSCWAAGVQRKLYIEGMAGLLIDAIYVAESIEELEAIVDERV